MALSVAVATVMRRNKVDAACQHDDYYFAVCVFFRLLQEFDYVHVGVSHSLKASVFPTELRI